MRGFVRLIRREWPSLDCTIERVNSQHWWAFRITWAIDLPVTLAKMRKLGKQFFSGSPEWITTLQPRNSGLYTAPGKELFRGSLRDIVALYTH